MRSMKMNVFFLLGGNHAMAVENDIMILKSDVSGYFSGFVGKNIMYD